MGVVPLLVLFLSGTTTSITRLALLRSAAVVTSTTVVTPRKIAAAYAANPPPPPLVPLDQDLLLILRVQEAAGQEARLVRTGKYRELQRLNIKRAIGMMIDNYDLRDRFVRASASAPSGKLQAAADFGNNAVENLIQVLEYFPSNLVANDLTREQKDFVLAALDANSKNIDSFLSLMPPDEVSKARAEMEEENSLNLKEFDGGKYLNPPIVEQDIFSSAAKLR